MEIKQIENLLKLTYGIVPIAAGADKFLNLLTQWDGYISPAIAGLLPMEAASFMIVVGVVEIFAGILVFIRTRVGAYVVSGWLVVIALSLLFTWHHADVAVRDIVMAIGAFTLAKLTEINQLDAN